MTPVVKRIKILDPSAFQHAKTIVIAGNAGLKESDKRVIDSAECVVRFNNHATRKGIGHLINTYRCDTLFTTFDLRSKDSNPKAVVVGIPFPFKCGSIKEKLHKWYNASDPYVINPYLNLDLIKDLGLSDKSMGYAHPIPSVGFTAIWHLFRLLEFRVDWKPMVHVCGFNWYSDIDNLTIQDRKPNAPRAWHFNHHYREEMKWIIENLMDNPNWSFSDECFKILSTFKNHLLRK